jgi:catechol 2,3-dioxygenase-like lactoylglutathione lyase family enzyme
LKPLRLNHLNLPATDPEALGDWYVAQLGFRRRGRFLWSEGTLLVFVPGKRVEDKEVHFGFRLDAEDEVHAWAEKLRGAGATVSRVIKESGYTTVFARDPEGNRFELFWEPDENWK